MNYAGFTNDSVTMMYEGIRGALALMTLSAVSARSPDSAS